MLPGMTKGGRKNAVDTCLFREARLLFALAGARLDALAKKTRGKRRGGERGGGGGGGRGRDSGMKLGEQERRNGRRSATSVWTPGRALVLLIVVSASVCDGLDCKWTCPAALVYTVREGQTTMDINRLFGVVQSSIITNLGDPVGGWPAGSTFEPNLTLLIPIKDCICDRHSLTRMITYFDYNVEPGDTLVKIEEQYGGLTSVADLRTQIADGTDNLFAGHRQKVPVPCACRDFFRNLDDPNKTFVSIVTFPEKGVDRFTLEKTISTLNSTLEAISAANPVAGQRFSLSPDLNRVLLIPSRNTVVDVNSFDSRTPVVPPSSASDPHPEGKPKRERTNLIVGIGSGLVVVILGAVLITVILYCQKEPARKRSHHVEHVPFNPMSGRTGITRSSGPSQSRSHSQSGSRSRSRSQENDWSPRLESGAWESIDGDLGNLSDSPIQYSCEEIQDATINFTHEKIGQGGYGVVYKATLRNVDVAIKQMKGEMGKAFQAEAAVLLKAHHVGLVRLLGYCNRKCLCLVYEYCANGSLSFNLRSRQGHVLDWLRRVQIALDAAEGLKYIHTQMQPTFVHRDVKSDNILLDANFRGKLGDFGLARDGPTAATTYQCGSFGYIPPEYTKQIGNPTTYGDIYAFGVVLFEIVTGRLPICRPTEDQTFLLADEMRVKVERLLGKLDPLSHWSAISALEVDWRELQVMMDDRLRDDSPQLPVFQMLVLAHLCTEDEPRRRPSIVKVVNILDEILTLSKQATYRRSLPSPVNSNMFMTLPVPR